MTRKIYSIIAISALLLLSGSCSSDSDIEETQGKPVELQEFTSGNATEAIDAFNNQFYSENMQLYHTKSDKTGVAAIWTQAIYWDMVMNAYLRTNDARYYRLIDEIYEGGYRRYDKYNWNNTIEWFIYDDIMWWVISMVRAYEITKDKKYLDHSISGFGRVWSGAPGVDTGSYDPEKGGMYWGWKSDQRGKTACINYPTIIAAMMLYNITGEEHYLDKAKEIYKWSRNALFDKNDGKVADHKYMDEPTNWTTQLYNQATCIGAAVLMYNQSKDKQYLDDAILATDYTKNTMSDKSGALPFKTGIEQGIYGAIFAQYVIRLIEDGNQPHYMEWLRYNINKAWANKNTQNVTYKNINISCPTGIIEVYDASTCPALMQVVPVK